MLSSITWGTQLNDTDVTVAFMPQGTRVWAGFGDYYTSDGFTAYEKDQIKEALNLIEAVTDLSFEVVTTSSRRANADFKLVLDTNELDSNLLGFFNPPNFANPGVGVFNGTQWDRSAGGDLHKGGAGFSTIVHELLHGLGLAHPHDGGGSSTVMPGVTSAFDDYGRFDLNQGVFTAMTYNSGYWTGTPGSAPKGDRFGYEAGPMALDIAVLQDLYGASERNKGDTVYTLPGKNAVGTFWSSIWDTGGTDEIRYTGSRDTTIDLRAATLVQGEGAGGYISAAKGVAGGRTIANGVVIENAKSGAGDDKLVGNSADNRLSGKSGADELRGRKGDDTLKGGGGDDLLLGARGDDKLIGNGGADKLQGNQGRDRLLGGTGEDVLNGGSGNDVLKGGSRADELTGGLGADTLFGGRGADVFVFNAPKQSRPGEDNRDVIGDFKTGLDLIDLREIDADHTKPGNQMFDFIGQSGFKDAGDVRLVKTGPDFLVQGDVNGDGTADFEILLLGADRPQADDFLL